MDSSTLVLNGNFVKTAITQKKRITGLYFTAFITLGLATAALGPTLPELARLTQTHLSVISSLFVARSLGYLIGAFMGGRLYDRFSGHPIIALVSVLMAVILALIPLMTHLWILFGLILFLGIVEGQLDVGANTLLMWLHQDRVGPFMNGLHFFFGIGAFFSPIIIAELFTRTGDLRWPFWLLALLTLPIGFGILRQPSPQSQRSTHTEKRWPVNYRLVLIIALFFLTYGCAESGFGGWIYTYALKMKLSTVRDAGYLTATFWGALTLGRLLAIPVARRILPQKMLLVDLLGGLISLGLIWIWPAGIWIGTFGLGISLASIFPTLLNLAGKFLGLTGRITGIFFVASSIGSMSLPWLIGQLFEPIGPQVTIISLLIVLTCAVIIYCILTIYMRKISDAVQPAA